MDIRPGDILALKKQHPCGENAWRVLRVGVDFKLICLGCGHEIMVARVKIEKRVKNIKSQEPDGV